VEINFTGKISLDFFFNRKKKITGLLQATNFCLTQRSLPQWCDEKVRLQKCINKINTANIPEEITDDDLPRRQLDIFKNFVENIDESTDHFPGINVVLKGTRQSLLDRLFFPLEQDSTYSEIFLMNHRFFMSSLDLLDGIIGWYNVYVDNNVNVPKKLLPSIRERAIVILRSWIKNNWFDFESNPQLYMNLKKFMQYLVGISFLDSQYLISTVQERVFSFN
jgi:hypothetical protein